MKTNTVSSANASKSGSLLARFGISREASLLISLCLFTIAGWIWFNFFTQPKGLFVEERNLQQVSMVTPSIMALPPAPKKAAPATSSNSSNTANSTAITPSAGASVVALPPQPRGDVTIAELPFLVTEPPQEDAGSGIIKPDAGRLTINPFAPIFVAEVPKPVAAPVQTAVSAPVATPRATQTPAPRETVAAVVAPARVESPEREAPRPILADAPAPKPIAPPSPRASNLPKALPSGVMPVQANLLTTPTRIPVPVVAAPLPEALPTVTVTPVTVTDASPAVPSLIVVTPSNPSGVITAIVTENVPTNTALIADVLTASVASDIATDSTATADIATGDTATGDTANNISAPLTPALEVVTPTAEGTPALTSVVQAPAAPVLPTIALNRVATVRVPGATTGPIMASAPQNTVQQVASLPSLSQSPAAPQIIQVSAAPKSTASVGTITPLGLSVAQNYSDRIDSLQAEAEAAAEKARQEELAKIRAEEQAKAAEEARAQAQAQAKAAQEARAKAEAEAKVKAEAAEEAKAAEEAEARARAEAQAAEEAAAKARAEAQARAAAQAAARAEAEAKAAAAQAAREREAAISVSAGLSNLNRYIRDQNLRFTGAVLGPVSVGIFAAGGRSFSVQLGQSLPNTDIRLTGLKNQEAELTQGDEKQILLLDLRR